MQTDIHTQSQTQLITLPTARLRLAWAEIIKLKFCLFHRRTRASYVYNGCLAWYNVVLTHGSTQA